MSDTILVELRGFLGNNLFQFAAGYAIALRTGGHLLFFNPHSDRTAAEALAAVIGDAYQEASPRQALAFGRFAYQSPRRDRIDAVARRWSQRSTAVTGRPRVIKQWNAAAAWAYDPRLEAAVPPVLLDGLFQNETYFEKFASQIDARISLPPVDDVLAGAARPLVAVSFRRADYINHRSVLPLGFYIEALARLQQAVHPGGFVITSDDPAFAELAVPWLETIAPVIDGASAVGSTLEQLALIAACDYCIIANSTFAWWGAWLAERRRGQSSGSEPCVYAPSGWMSGNDEILPRRWDIVPSGR